MEGGDADVLAQVVRMTCLDEEGGLSKKSSLFYLIIILYFILYHDIRLVRFLMVIT